MMPISAYYLNPEAKRIAEIVANGNSNRCLNINLNIDGILLRRNPEVVTKVCIAIENGLPFILYHDTEKYAVIDPIKRAIHAYMYGKKTSTVVSINQQEFQNNIKLAYACYDKFYQSRTGRSIADREHGNAEIPCGSDGENLQNVKNSSDRGAAELPEQTLGAV